MQEHASCIHVVIFMLCLGDGVFRVRR